ncbi:MAG: PIG-L deacetylase family protein [Pirellulaceae bacterium]
MPVAFAIAAHPDDIEFFMAGTMMMLKDAGYTLHYMNVADGCCGTTEFDVDTIARLRLEEARAAADYLGAVFHPPICPDLEIFYDRPTLLKLSSVMREVAPDILLTHSPSDYMEDHMNTCRLAVTAAFARCMPNFPVQPPRDAVLNKVTVYHAQPYSHRDPLRRIVEPDFFVDVTSVVDRKVQMLGKHATQKTWLDQSQGQDSYLQTLRELDEECGRMSGLFEYAEGWRRHLHLGFCGEKDDPLCDALKGRVLQAR